MRLNTLMSEVAASLSANRLRVALAVLGMATGVASVSVMVAVGEGGRRHIQATITSMGADLLFVEPQHSGDTLRALTPSDAEALENHPSFVGAAPLSDCVYTDARSIKGRSYSCVIGTTPSLFGLRRWALAEGSLFAPDDQRSVVIGSGIAARLFNDSYPIGQLIETPNGSFRVAGVLKPLGPSVDGRMQDEDIYLHTEAFRARFIKDSYTEWVARIVVKIRPNIGPHTARNTLHDVFRRTYGLPTYAESPVEISDIASITDTMKKTNRTTSLVLAAIASISLLVAGIGIMNIMYVAVRERTREIGLRMAIGATPRDIVNQFQLEAVGIAVVGGLVGIALSYLLTSIGTRVWTVPMVHSLWGDSAALLAAVTIGLIFGILPARKAARLPPTVALRQG